MDKKIVYVIGFFLGFEYSTHHIPVKIIKRKKNNHINNHYNGSNKNNNKTKTKIRSFNRNSKVNFI